MTDQLRLVSWNINGVRACVKNGGISQAIKELGPDLLCLQEIKAKQEQFPPSDLDSFPSQSIHSAKRPGYSGVASYCSRTIRTDIGIGVEEFDSEGRILIHDVGPIYVINAYYPNGQRDHNRVPYKMKFYDAILEKALELKKKRPVVLCGDFNTAYEEIDLANPKTNKNTTGFLPQEREKFGELLEHFFDPFRDKHPGQNGHYTWWTYRNNCRERNVGWRIDYILVDPRLRAAIKAQNIHPNILGSDHCPVSADFQF